MVKFGCCEVAEKSSGIADKKTLTSGTCPSPPFCPHLANRAQNFVNIVSPWAVHVYRLWSGSTAVCRTYSGKGPKKSIHYRLLAHKQCSWRTTSASSVPEFHQKLKKCLCSNHMQTFSCHIGTGATLKKLNVMYIQAYTVWQPKQVRHQNSWQTC